MSYKYVGSAGIVIFTANGVVLFAPTIIKVDNEIIRSSNIGRTSSGAMVGDAVAEKKTVTIEWEVFQESEMVKIRKNLIAGFFPSVSNDDGGASLSITSYRGTINEEYTGFSGDGIYWYKKATVKIIQQQGRYYGSNN